MTLHVDPHARLRNIVSRALNGCAYEGSSRPERGMLVIDGRRPDGTRVHVRFRGVQDSESTAQPEAGGKMRLLQVSSAQRFSILQILMTRFPQHRFSSEARVRIEAGKARIDVVCQDVEWWEEPPGSPGTRAEAK
jgi:hypothetical protein